MALRSGVYAGRSYADLQARLTALQSAYDQLVVGQKVVTASYSQSDGARSVTYQQADLVRLQADIIAIQQALGMVRHGRRRIRFIYSGG
jgi:hypothetical protein